MLFNGRRALIMAPEAFHKATNLTGHDLSLFFKMPQKYINFFYNLSDCSHTHVCAAGAGFVPVVLANGVTLVLAGTILGVEVWCGGGGYEYFLISHHVNYVYVGIHKCQREIGPGLSLGG